MLCNNKSEPYNDVSVVTNVLFWCGCGWVEGPWVSRGQRVYGNYFPFSFAVNPRLLKNIKPIKNLFGSSQKAL